MYVTVTDVYGKIHQREAGLNSLLFVILMRNRICSFRAALSATDHDNTEIPHGVKTSRVLLSLRPDFIIMIDLNDVVSHAHEIVKPSPPDRRLLTLIQSH